MSKHLFIVRHAESQANSNNLTSDELTELSSIGVQQAESLANNDLFKDLQIIYVSPLKRSKQTGEVIAGRHGHLSIVENELIKEKKDPSSFSLLKRDELPWDDIKKHRMDPDWKIEDGESFNDVKKRVRLTLEMVEQSSEENILLVSHASFIKHLALFVILGDEFTPANFYKFGDRMETKNTGITTFKHKQKYYETSPSWYLMSWMS